MVTLTRSHSQQNLVVRIDCGHVILNLWDLGGEEGLRYKTKLA